MRNPPTSLNADYSVPVSLEDRDDIASRIRDIIRLHGRLGRDVSQLSDHDDLYMAGMTSLASVNVMLALESEFDIEFPDQMLNRSVFGSIHSIVSAIRKIELA